MTDANFEERELKAPRYLGGIYILDWTTIGADPAQSAPADPEETPKRLRRGRPATRSPFNSSTDRNNYT
ncbi:MAG: hypothetical protein ACKPKO_42505 [Candidatus Fonsibacter sp.]